MNKHRKSLFEIAYGAALIAACSGKLDEGRGQNGVTGNGGSAGEMGGGGGVVSVRTGGAGGVDASAGGSEVTTGGVWHSIPAGGGGYSGGGTAGCFIGPEPVSTGGAATGGKSSFGVTPTCPLDSEGFATVDLFDTDGGSASGLCALYTCPASSADLLKGLDCTEVTTERTGFTKTVGCGFETIEFQSYDLRAQYDLEHKYAASYDLSTGRLVGLVVKEPYQFEPCMSYAYRAGTVPAACPSAVTYKCRHVPLSGTGETAYAGCRAPDEAGCAQCCDAAAQAPYCDVYEAANGSTTYQTSGTQYHACRCDCTPCAHCKLEDERNVRVMIKHPECDCSLPPTGDPCGSWCASKPKWDSLCPGLL